MLTNTIDHLNIDKLQFNLVGQNFGKLDFSQAGNALKLDSLDHFSQKATANAGETSDTLNQFEDFITEAKNSRDSLAGAGPSDPQAASATSSDTKNSVDSSAASSDTAEASSEAVTWKIDSSKNLIALDNGYSLKLNEANSELLLQKTNSAGEIEKSTKIWGDPHLDAGNDGTNDADFWKDSTLALADGTKITIGTREKSGTDMTFADTLKITKGDQALEVTGLMDGADALNIGEVTMNGRELDAATNDGHVLVEGHGNDWQLQDGRTIGQDTEYLEFAQEEIDNEVRFGQAWMPDADTLDARGGNSAAMPDKVLVAGRTASPGIGRPGQISDALRDFLQMQGIEFDDEGNDGILSLDEWDSLIDALEDKRGGLAGGAKGMLQLLLQMKRQIAEMLEHLSLDNSAVA